MSPRPDAFPLVDERRVTAAKTTAVTTERTPRKMKRSSPSIARWNFSISRLAHLRGIRSVR